MDNKVRKKIDRFKKTYSPYMKQAMIDGKKLLSLIRKKSVIGTKLE